MCIYQIRVCATCMHICLYVQMYICIMVIGFCYMLIEDRPMGCVGIISCKLSWSYLLPKLWYLIFMEDSLTVDYAYRQVKECLIIDSKVPFQIITTYPSSSTSIPSISSDIPAISVCSSYKQIVAISLVIGKRWTWIYRHKHHVYQLPQLCHIRS